MKEKKDYYIDFCEKEKSLPLFFNYWWLDVVCGEGNWDVCISKDNEGNIRGVWPYFIENKMGLKVSRHPVLTPFLGIYFVYPEGIKRESKKSHFEIEVTNELLEQLPKFMYFRQNFTADYHNWLPLYWKDYFQTSYYTYIIENLEDVETVYQNIDYKRRSKIKKATKEYEVVQSDDIEKLFQISKTTYGRKGNLPPFTLAQLKRIDEALSSRGLRHIYFSKDKDGNILAGCYLVRDQEMAYYLVGGIDPRFKRNNPMSLIFWTMIKDMSGIVKQFNFEGSMNKQIETVFRAYGGKRKAFSVITKTRSKFIDLFYILLKNRRLK